VSGKLKTPMKEGPTRKFSIPIPLVKKSKNVKEIKVGFAASSSLMFGTAG